jgi:hypothetical protein
MKNEDQESRRTHVPFFISRRHDDGREYMMQIHYFWQHTHKKTEQSICSTGLILKSAFSVETISRRDKTDRGARHENKTASLRAVSSFSGRLTVHSRQYLLFMDEK